MPPGRRDHEHLVAAHDDAAVRGLELSRHSSARASGSCTVSLPRPCEITPARSSTARNRDADSREEPASCATSAWVTVSGTSLRPRPGLLDELAEHGRHAALDGLEGLAGEPLVGRPQAPRERDRERDRQLRALRHQTAHVGAEDRQHLERLDRLDRGRAALVVEHRQLAEDVAGAERGERERAAVRVLADGAGVAGADDVARVRGVALAEDDLAGREPRAGARPPRSARGPRAARSAKHGHARQQLDTVLCARGHPTRITTLRRVSSLGRRASSGRARARARGAAA